MIKIIKTRTIFYRAFEKNIYQENNTYMRYLILSADYNSIIRDEYNSEFELDDLNLSIELFLKLKDWYRKYYPLISMSDEERSKIQKLILELDEEGLNIAHLIMEQINDCKVKYFSEGQLKYLMV